MALTRESIHDAWWSFCEEHAIDGAQRTVVSDQSGYVEGRQEHERLDEIVINFVLTLLASKESTE